MASQLVKVDSFVPFGETIQWWMKFQDQNLAAVINESRRFDPAYLAWENVRKRRNPFLGNGTGFEGYLIGLCRTPEEAFERVLEINRGMLVGITRLHASDPRFKSKLMKVLLGESDDANAIAEWSAQLGATLAVLRANLLKNKQADDFRSETQRIVAAYPKINYQAEDDSVRQGYVLDGHLNVPTLIVDAEALKPDDQDAWLVAQNIGKFGHPLVRTFVRYTG